MFLLPSLLIFITKSSMGTQVDLCLNAYPNLHITCAVPYERRAVDGEQQCRELCLLRSARTCQYQRMRKLCELFDTIVALNSKNSEWNRNDRVKRRVNGVSMADLCTPSVAPAIGFLLFLNSGCSTDRSGQLRTNSALIPTADSNINVANRLAEENNLPILKISGNGTTDNANLQLPIPFHSSKAGIQHKFRAADSLLGVVDCAPNYSARIEVIDGIEVVAEGLATFQAPTLEACLYRCTKNTLVSGSRLPISCRSAQYHRISKRCILFGTTINPTGNAQYIPNEDVIYFEKICISSSVGMRCGQAMRRVPQYILAGHATAVIDAPSHNYCVEMCLRSLDVLGFTCRSVVHFYEYSKLNCIVNKESARTRPEYFTSEHEQKVDYVELDECSITASEKDDAEWSEWSECDHGSGSRYRKRICPSCPTSIEQMPCFSGEDFRSKFPALYAEQNPGGERS